MKKKILSLLAAFLFLAVASTLAHHSVSAQFDYDQPVELKGVITKLEWVNPHSYMYLDVKNSSGVVDHWTFESFGVGGLKKKGVDADLIKVGQSYTVRGFRSKDGKNNAFLQEIELPDGRKFRVWFGDPNGTGN